MTPSVSPSSDPLARCETILITGATGTVGSAVIRQLATRRAQSERAVTVRALSRNPAADVPAEVQLAVGDFNDPESLRRAMQDVTRVFLVGSGKHIATQDEAAVEAARRAGVGHIVKLSVLGVGRGGDDPITSWHRAGEGYVRGGGTRWTMLRPTGFMSNTLGWADSIRLGDTVYAPFADGRTALVDPGDIARVAVAALTQDGHDGRAYELTGPQALGPGDQVRILSEVTGRPIRYVEISSEAARDQLETYGMPADLADAVIQLLASAREPWNAHSLPDVRTVTGRPPADFRAWATAHRHAFASSR